MFREAYRYLVRICYPPAGTPGQREETHTDRLRTSQSHLTVMPPSTTISAPVTKRASSEARNSAALAVSRPSPMKPNEAMC